MKKKIFLFLLIILLINLYKLSNQNYIIPETSIRLRVIPNSNEPNDIYIKEKVKKYLETNFYPILTNDINETREIIKNNLNDLESNIDFLFKENDYHEDFKINYGNNYFPEKIYNGVTYKEGYYESLVISIGDANGDNFWCVLFPNLCLIDSSEDIEYKSYFKELFHKIF